MNRSRRLVARRSIGARRRRNRRAPSFGFETDASVGLPVSTVDPRPESATPGLPEAADAPVPTTPPRG